MVFGTYKFLYSPLVDRNQVNKATLALIKWAKKNADKNQNIVGNHQSLWVVVTTKKFPDSVKVKPVPIPISHSLYKDADICLFTKDPQRTYKDMVAEANLPQIKKVIGISKLKSKFKPYEAKRQLNDSYDLFLVDEPVVEFLPKALGKSFFNKKKYQLLFLTLDCQSRSI
ncbi:hypothetical protein HDV02_002068 [Globomyces sp. JEL0801]|nr:hypothetical protein HDV02_002068 [Globomyces sp. JEL0801]